MEELDCTLIYMKLYKIEDEIWSIPFVVAGVHCQKDWNITIINYAYLSYSYQSIDQPHTASSTLLVW